MRILIGVILACVLCFPAYAAEQFKVGYVDLQRALNQSDAGARSKTELESLIKQKQAVINSKINEKERLEAELDKKSTMLSDEAASKRMDEIEKLERDIQRMISDYNTEVQKLQREKEISILKDLDAIISILGKELDYEIIFPSDMILYISEGKDLTDLVIERYNDMLKENKKGELKK